MFEDVGRGGSTLWTHLFLSPANQPGGRPFDVALMGFGTMRRIGGEAATLVTAWMQGDALASMEDLDRVCAQADFDGLVGETVRNAVVMPVDLNMIVDVGFGFAPQRQFVTGGWQRL